MAKIDGVVAKETRYIAGITIILSILMEAVFLIIGMWSYKVLIGNILGAAVAVVNFLLMGITVQNAVQKDEKDAASLMKVSQMLRNLMLLITALLAFLLPFINPAAAIIPLFFFFFAILLIPVRDRKISNGKENSNGE